MSFAVDLWNGYSIIYNNFISRRKGLKFFVYMLSEKYEADLEYAKNMKKIYDLNFEITSEGTLLNGVKAFKNNLLYQSETLEQYINKLKSNIIEPLKIFQTKQETIGKKLNNEMMQIDKEFREAYDKLEKSKMRYHSCTKNSEDAKIGEEQSKGNTSLFNDHRAKFKAKCETALRTAKEAEKEYISQLNLANNTRDYFISNTKRILEGFEDLEQSYIDFLKEILKKQNFNQNVLFMTLQNNYELNEKLIESIDSRKDIRDFIEKNAISNTSPPNKFEFVPYHSEILTKPYDQNHLPIDIINALRNFIQTTFLTNVPEVEPDAIESKNNSEIHLMVNNAWDGKTFGQEEKKNFLKLIKEKKYRKYMLNCLNKFRTNGQFTLDDRSYSILGDLLKEILDEIYIHKDYESAKYCMLLSQTFFKPTNDIFDQKNFLLATIENHEIWKNIEFWEQMIKCKSYFHLVSIDEEMNKQSLFALYNYENRNDEKTRNENCIFGQLISFIFNMISFDVRKEIVQDLIMEFCKIHNLSQELTLQISRNIHEYNVRKSILIRNELVDDNNSLISDEINGLDIDKNLLSKNTENDSKASYITNSKFEPSDKNSFTLLNK